VGPIQ